MRALKIILLFSLFPFVGNSQMILSGAATGSCDCYEITDATNESGSIWSPTSIDLTNPFDFTFTVNLGVNDAFGADGMMFVLRQTGTTTGGIGNGLGYSGIINSVGIEIDTWNSSPAVASDIVSDHTGMSSNGDVEHDLVAPVAIVNIEDGLDHLFRATWDPITFDLEVFIDGISVFVYNGDLVTTIFGGTPDVFFGWTGGTGGAFNIQSVCMFRDAEITPDVLTTCVGQTVSFTDASTSDLNYNLNEAITWDWDFGDGTTSILENPTHTYATAGTYTIQLTITDISGCSSVETVDIDVTPEIDVTVTKTDVTCNGLDDGTATAMPTTGTGPYTYSWDDPMMQTTVTSIDLAPNTYEITVTDALGCMGTETITIIEPVPLVIDSSVPTNASCGTANGTITVAASGGTPGLEYSIDGGVTFMPTGNFTGLTNGSYTVVVRDLNGCLETTTTIVGLDSPLMIDMVDIVDETCAGMSDGTITITASSGMAPFEYSIDGGATYQVSNFFDLLAAGMYTISVLDANGCEVPMNVTVGSSPSVVIDGITVVDATCNGIADGEIMIMASGGTPGYTYSTDGGVTFLPGSTVTGLLAGMYDVAVMDAMGCTVTGMTSIAEPTVISIDAIADTPVSCSGMSDGEFDLTVSGGTPGYTYSNDGGITFQVSSSFTGLAAGTYDLVIEDASGCTITGMTTVLSPAPLMLTGIVVTDVTCNGLMDGGLSFTVAGGTAPYEYSVSGGAFGMTSVITGLGGGDTPFEIRDANGCSISGMAFLAEADPLVLSVGMDTTICLGGQATLCPTLSGGTAPFDYNWDGVPASPMCLVTPVVGTHSLQVTDINGCTSELLSQIVDQYIPLSVLSSSASTICPDTPITIAGEADGDGPDGYTYTWTNDVDGIVLTGPVQTVEPNTTTTYTLTVSVGCENTASTTVTISTFPIPNLIITADVTEGCEDLRVNLENLSDPGLVANSFWTLGDATIASGTTVAHTYTEAGCYDIDLELMTVDGCIENATFDDFICVWKRPIADFSFNPDQPDLFNSTVFFSNESEFGDSYEWSFGDGGGSSDFSPSHGYPEIGNVTYEVQLKVTSAEGCMDTETQFITLNEVVLYYVPNTFTPNSDPFNQTLTPVFIPGFTPSNYTFKIFNRYGELIFESQNPTIGWDGSFNGGIPQDGIYTWQITFRENKSDKKFVDYGHITLLR